MYKVTYTVKNDEGFLVDKVKHFDIMQDACKFIRDLVNRSAALKLIGRPIVERS